MTSIISCIGLPGRTSSLDSTGNPNWNFSKSFSENIDRFNTEDQFRGYVEQLLVISYYCSFYGKRCVYLINDYIDEIVIDFSQRILPKFLRENKDNGAQLNIAKSMTALLGFIETGKLKESIDIESLSIYLSLSSNPELPRTVISESPNWAIPYLMWLCTTQGFNIPVKTFSDPHGAGLLRLSFTHPMKSTPDLGGSFLAAGKIAAYVTTYFMGPTYSVEDYSPLDISLLDHLARFNTGARNLESIIGVVGDLCLTLDTRRDGVEPSQILAAIIRTELLGVMSYAGDHHGVRKFNVYGRHNLVSNRDYFLAFKKFTEYVTTKYGVKINDRNFVADIFDCFAVTREQKDSVSYIRNQGGSASAEQHDAFNKTLGSLEALQFISQNNTLLSAQSQDNPVAAADGTDTEKEKSESTEDEKNSEEAKPGKKSEDDTKDGEKPGKDDTTEEDEADTEDDSKPEEEGENGKEETSSDASSASGVSDMPSDDEPQPDTSSIKGFKFKISNPDNETTDSVMFREEMDHFLTNVLANPPEDLSPQKIQTLTSLQKYWLHTLSLETIMGIVGSCLKQLPESFIQLTTQLWSNTNE